MSLPPGLVFVSKRVAQSYINNRRRGKGEGEDPINGQFSMVNGHPKENVENKLLLG
jgi:hypothetical protein